MATDQGVGGSNPLTHANYMKKQTFKGLLFSCKEPAVLVQTGSIYDPLRSAGICKVFNCEPGDILKYDPNGLEEE